MAPPINDCISQRYESVQAIVNGVLIYHANKNIFSENIVIKLTWVESLHFDLMICSIQSRLLRIVLLYITKIVHFEDSDTAPEDLRDVTFFLLLFTYDWSDFFTRAKPVNSVILYVRSTADLASALPLISFLFRVRFLCNVCIQ